uniref:Uncharacterized protein n=1 Tax=Glossina austeni TaxID=7395 RepID=A0A1A9VU87_GLOAU
MAQSKKRLNFARGHYSQGIKCNSKKSRCVQGEYPEAFVKLWEDYDDVKRSRNHNPNCFSDTLEWGFSGMLSHRFLLRPDIPDISIPERYTRYRERGLEERQIRFQNGWREGHTEISFVGSGTNLQLVFNATQNPYVHDKACDSDKEHGKVHIKSYFIMHGVHY